MYARLSVPGGGDDAQAVLHFTFLPERAQRLQLLPPDPLVTCQGAVQWSPGPGQAHQMFLADIKLTLIGSDSMIAAPDYWPL